MLAATILRIEGAVSRNVPRGVAFPAEARGGECGGRLVVWASQAARGREGGEGKCPVVRGRIGWGVMLT